MNETSMNLTLSFTTSAPGPDEHLAFKVTKILVYLFIFVLSMLGNCTVIAIILRSRIMKLVAGNLLILNLALCDFLTPFLSIPFDMAVEENNGQWLYGRVMCKFLWPAATWTATSSSLTLAAIAFERYRGLMHPFRSRLTITHVKKAILSIHASSFVVVIPYALVLDVTEEGLCKEHHWPDPYILLRQAYTMSLFIVQYVAPLFFMTFMYSQTSKSLFVTTERVRSSSISSVDSTASTDIARPRSGSFGNATNRTEPRLSRSIFRTIQQEQNVKITKMFIVVVIIFAIFMLPNQVVWLWLDFGEGYKNKNFTLIAIICRFFTYTNSCLNPLIFFKFSREFRRGFRRTFLRPQCCVKQRRRVSLAYRKWRASRTGTRTSVTQSTSIPPSKSGQILSSLSPSQNSETITSSVFEKYERKAPAPVANKSKTPLQREITSPQGFWKNKIGNLKTTSCSFLHAFKGKPKDALVTPRKCGKLHDKAEAPKLSLVEENKININTKDLLTLPQLEETSC